jgi:IclR family transcriptional regulator, acetate operon repressor
MTTSPRTDDEPVLGAQTVVRALAVLGLVRRATTDVGVSEISRALALHTSTVHRILKALVSEGYLSQNPETDRYRLGRESWLLGLAAERNLGFAAVAPVLERLRKTTGESANLVVRDGEHGLVVLRVESEQPLRFTQPVGARIPLYCTSTGKALLAFAHDYTTELAGVGELTAMTSTTITSKAALARELEAVRARGWSTNRGERIDGVCGVAAPVLDPSTGEAAAAVAVQGPAVRIPESRMADLAVLVVEAAAEIATILPSGYRI